VTSFEEIDDLIICIDAEDPMTYDQEFINRVRYVNFVKCSSDFSDESRAFVQSDVDRDPLMLNKFFIEVYTDKFLDFVQATLYNHQWQRALIFREERSIGPDIDLTSEDLDPTEISEMMLVSHIYELKTLAKTDLSVYDDSDVEVETSSEKDESELDKKMDAETSLFLKAPKSVH